MTGAIAFSLFGTLPMYLAGALRNAELAQKIYPNWKAIFYCDTDIPETIQIALIKLKAEVRPPVEGIKNQLFWRFCIADDAAFERFIVRDCDSRLSPREKGAVDQWIASGLDWHTMGDHPAHCPPMGGGLFGGKCRKIAFKSLIIKSGLANKKFVRDLSYDMDQHFLANYVYPTAKLSMLRHDSCARHLYRDAVPFPDGCRFGSDRFVGEIFDQHDIPHPTHWQARLNFMTP